MGERKENSHITATVLSSVTAENKKTPAMKSKYFVLNMAWKDGPLVWPLLLVEQNRHVRSGIPTTFLKTQVVWDVVLSCKVGISHTFNTKGAFIFRIEWSKKNRHAKIQNELWCGSGSDMQWDRCILYALLYNNPSSDQGYARCSSLPSLFVWQPICLFSIQTCPTHPVFLHGYSSRTLWSSWNNCLITGSHPRIDFVMTFWYKKISEHTEKQTNEAGITS